MIQTQYVNNIDLVHILYHIALHILFVVVAGGIIIIIIPIHGIVIMTN